MPKRLFVEPHLSLEELKYIFHEAESHLDQKRIKIVWMISRGMTTRRVAEKVQMHPQSVREIVWRYNKEGPSSLYDKRHHAKGRPPLLNRTLMKELEEVLQEPPVSGGVWTGPKVAAWISEKLDRPVRDQRGWDYLKRLLPDVDEESISRELLEAVQRTSSELLDAVQLALFKNVNS